MSTLSKAMKKLEAAALLVLIPIMLAACAHPQLIDLGTAESQVVQKLGEPNATVPLADGRTRLVYSQQPFGQECWWMTFSADGRHLAMMPHLERSCFPWQNAYYPADRIKNDQITPWMEAFVNARKWIEMNKK